ncbi:MAG: acyl carrier protein [Blastocatellia bacterium]|nr:acyl carrier protein [Blastocatellia bacterium]
MLPTPVLHYLTQAAQTAGTTLPDAHTSLFFSGLLDSFSLLDFVAVLEETCGIHVPDKELRPETFDTIAKIEAFIAKAH